jgi:hypothetical protein
MSSDKKDWNAIFAQRKAVQDAERAAVLAVAKVAASATEKEAFDGERFREIYRQINADCIDQYTPWDTLVTESEYNYYVTFREQMTLTDFVNHMRYMDGWG